VTLSIVPDDLSGKEVQELLAEHLADMHATSPPESVHALDLDGLRDPAVTFYSAWLGNVLMGCGALKELGDGHAEIKSMRTSSHARGRGVGGQLLAFLLAEAHDRALTRVSLETGVEPYFAAARRMYARHGFIECPPFGSYRPDPNSVFMTRTL
jgi:putative acetyltransferase